LVALASCKPKSSQAVVKEKQPSAFAVISLKEHFYDFGKIKDGDTVEHTYLFTNTGKFPLMIKDISTSCGCTVLKWSDKPVAPNSTDSITVQFSKHHDPGVHFKQIIVKANTKDPYTVLNFKAFIEG